MLKLTLAASWLVRHFEEHPAPDVSPHQPPLTRHPVAEFTQIPSLLSTPELDLVKFELVSKLVVKQINPSFIIAALRLFLSGQISV